jgi:ribosomal protein S18 acetylase RimI-like enzyme
MVIKMIRKIERDEIPACVDVIRTSFLTVAQEYNITQENAPRYTAYATTVERLEYQLSEGRPMFVYIDENMKIVGYYSLNFLENNECELNNLCVLPEYRHMKIGEKLIEHAFSAAKQSECRIMNIGIVEENVKLRKWYELYGFKHIETRKFDFFPFTCGYMRKEL